MKTLAIDVGNSRWTWGCFEGETITSKGQVEGIDALVSCDIPWKSIEAIGIGSVDRKMCGELVSGLESLCGVEPLVMSSAAEVPVPVLLEDRVGVGSDRALNALAWTRRNPGKGAVILDAGTALTVDGVSSEGEFLGGWIAPGFRMSASALCSGTAQLPLATLKSPSGPWGKDTQGAISGGVETLLAAGACSLRDRVLSGLEPGAETVVTGGDGERLLAVLGGEAQFLADLTLEGIVVAVSEDRSAGGD